MRGLSRQVGTVRKRQPELAALARRLDRQMQTVSAEFESRSLEPDGLVTVSDALGQVAEGLDGVSQTLTPTGVTEMSKGLSGTADYLEDKVLPAADRAATALDKASAGLKADAGKLRIAFDKTPLELKSLAATVESLKRFEDGLGQMAKLAKLESFETMREGFKGLETSLESGAEQVERLSKYTYPKVEIKGLRLEVEEKDFWPDGKKIADRDAQGREGVRGGGQGDGRHRQGVAQTSQVAGAEPPRRQDDPAGAVHGARAAGQDRAAAEATAATPGVARRGVAEADGGAGEGAARDLASEGGRPGAAPGGEEHDAGLGQLAATPAGAGEVGGPAAEDAEADAIGPGAPRASTSRRSRRRSS